VNSTKKHGNDGVGLFGHKGSIRLDLDANDVAVCRGRRGREEYDHASVFAVDADECPADYPI
jgi:hypothetical protein